MKTHNSFSLKFRSFSYAIVYTSYLYMLHISCLRGKDSYKMDRLVIGGKIYTVHRANVFTQRGNKGQTKRRISECSEKRRRTQNNHLLPKKVTDIHN